MQPLVVLEEDSPDPVLSFRVSAYAYDSRAAQAVRRLKYSRATSLAGFMSNAVATAACDAELVEDRLIIPVPIHWSRRCSRGFNQAELLCEGFPKAVVKRRLLFRSRATPPQASLRAEQRKVNLVDAFRVDGRLDGHRIMLVDDVVTTGHTARECARVLMAAGAIDVGLVTFAAEL
jgi:ComF family protein